MFLRVTKRKKDGKIHHYWSVVENVRVGRRVFQRRALYLGELNDSQHAEWQRAIEAIDENGRITQLKLFPEERAPASDDGSIVRIQMNRLSVGNMRNWGEVWFGLQLWDMLELDNFWSSRIDKSRKGTDWLALLKAIVIYRLTAPGSELQMHERWLKDCAAEELFGPGVLTGRASFSAMDTADKRGDCLQVVIALVLTPDGYPLSYEVLPGNTNDRNTQMPFIEKLEKKYGKIGNLWLMDRGVPSEETLQAMREGGYRYLVGAPRGHLKILGKKLEEAKWEEVQQGIEVKTAQADGDTFVLTRSNARSLKETSMRVKKIRGAMKTLFALDKRIGRSKWRTIEASDRKLTRDELIRRLAVAESKAGRAWKMISVSIPGEGEDVTLDSFTWHLDWAKIREARRNDEGTYLLRTNLTDCDPKTLWKKYMIQGEIEYAFREMKHDLGLRPVYHQLDDRIEAHIFTSFMAFCLLTTLRAMAREHAPGLTPRQIITNLKTIKMVDVVMPTTDGRVVTLPRSVEPKEEVALLLKRLGLTLPDQPPPKISESPSVT